ncbi:MAG TPA: histidine kinase [Sphingomicrobium sp.]|nr:histidine kinase [Sphingomicrobium sp.]
MFKYQSGRVIALGRAMLAAMFLLAIWLDRSQPTQSVPQTYAFLLLYLCFALALAAATWSNWWLDARLAIPAHLVDMSVFAVIVFSTNGYTSPFFLVFILPLLSAAIRWGWRETALTAAALVLLFFTGGMLVAGSMSFELQRFIVRTTHLIILSAILIWFGIHQRFTSLFVRLDDFDSLIGQVDGAPLALRVAMEAAGAAKATLLTRSPDDQSYAGLRIAGESVTNVEVAGPLVLDPAFGSSFLFDVRNDRALTKTSRSWSCFGRARALLDPAESDRLGLASGLVTKLRSGTAEGWLILEEIPELSGDYIDLGLELGRAAGSMLDRSALVSAIEESVAAQTRLTLARDVHDSIVQFLAGASFRVEAIARAARSGSKVEADLTELKRLMVDEQTEIRSFVSALRRDRAIELDEVVEDLRALAVRLSQQWSIECKVSAAAREAVIPIRVHLDLQQLLREAVAKADRHGGADRVGVELAVDGDLLTLDLTDNGTGFVANGAPLAQPWSLKERVDRAHGSLALVSKPGRTDISISLPLAGVTA